MELKCTVCGEKFEAIKSTKKYCSQKCMYKASEERRLKRIKEGKTLGGMESKNCLLCEIEFKPKTSAANQRSCCYDCMPEGTQLRRGDFIAKLKVKEGGKCIRCGYNTCMSALDFHHRDPNKKEFGISDDSIKLKDAIEEVKKCVLICSNCHRELHAKLWKIEELKGR